MQIKLFNKWIFMIYPVGGTPLKERVRKLYAKRKAKGLCEKCGNKVVHVNPITGKLYKKCAYHRAEEAIDCVRRRKLKKLNQITA